MMDPIKSLSKKYDHNHLIIFFVDLQGWLKVDKKRAKGKAIVYLDKHHSFEVKINHYQRQLKKLRRKILNVLAFTFK